MDIREELNVPPKRRITIPEGKIAVLLPVEVAEDVKLLCILIRKGKRLNSPESNSIAGNLLLAIVEAEDGQ